MTVPNPFQIVEPDLGPADPEPVGQQIVQPSTTTGNAPTGVTISAASIAAAAAGTPVPTGVLAPLPAFEGEPISRSTVKIVSAIEINLTDEVLGLDDIMRLVGEFRVVSVYFKSDPKTGETVREHIVKNVGDGMVFSPWDLQDSTDQGIRRKTR